MRKSWLVARPELIEEIRQDLRTHYPNLHLFVQGSKAQIRGTFPVRGVSGRELNRYQVEIDLPTDYPRALPVVCEVGGQIPRQADKYHINQDGTACVLLEDQRGECFPEGARFLQYLNVPLYNYFLGQSLVARGKDWPFDEWEHGVPGIFQYYCLMFGTTDRDIIVRFLKALTVKRFGPRRRCPCRRWRRVSECCGPRILEFRKIVSRWTAQRALRILMRVQ